MKTALDRLGYEIVTVTLWCGNHHDHKMAPEQADRLEGTPCPWCRMPLQKRRP